MIVLYLTIVFVSVFSTVMSLGLPWINRAPK